MNDSANYFSLGAGDYQRYRPRYPDALIDHLAQLSPARHQCWDVGCGNGQATVALAKRFERVTGSDASARQVAQAEKRANISYRVSPAETIAADDNSLDLITVAQAIHWFDHSRFFAEVKRSLKPGGVLAAWGYQLLYTDTALDPWIQHFHSEVVGAYWPRGRELLDEGYTRIAFPFPREDCPAMFMSARWSIEHLLGYLSSWSAVKRYQEMQGRNPLEEHGAELRAAWGRAETRSVYWPLILYVGRKPNPNS